MFRHQISLMLLLAGGTVRVTWGQSAAFDYTNARTVIRDHCLHEWPTDFSMRAYCEKQQNEAVETLRRGQPSGVPGDQFRSIRERCAGEWSDDYNMRAYCEKQQFAALSQLDRTSAAGSVEERTLHEHCAREWSSDFNMRAYCEKQQRSAVATLAQGRPSDIPEDVFQQMRSKCASDWSDDFTMRAYCERQQYQGYRSVGR